MLMRPGETGRQRASEGHIIGVIRVSRRESSLPPPPLCQCPPPMYRGGRGECASHAATRVGTFSLLHRSPAQTPSSICRCTDTITRPNPASPPRAAVTAGNDRNAPRHTRRILTQPAAAGGSVTKRRTQHGGPSLPPAAAAGQRYSHIRILLHRVSWSRWPYCFLAAERRPSPRSGSVSLRNPCCCV